MRGQMVHSVERFVQSCGKPLGRADPDHESTGETRPRGHGDGVDIGQLHLGGLARRGDGRADGLHMGAGGDFGHDTAEADVFVHRRGHGVRQQFASADDADPGFVARGFDAQDKWFAHASSSASSAVSAISRSRSE